MKREANNYLVIVAVDKEEEEDMSIIRASMKRSMKSLKLNAITIINLNIILRNIIVMLKKKLTFLMEIKRKKIKHC